MQRPTPGINVGKSQFFASHHRVRWLVLRVIYGFKVCCGVCLISHGGFELDVVPCVIGGVSIAGGIGSVGGLFLARYFSSNQERITCD